MYEGFQAEVKGAVHRSVLCCAVACCGWGVHPSISAFMRCAACVTVTVASWMSACCYKLATSAALLQHVPPIKAKEADVR
jgi:hypothetical protein